MRPIRMCQWSDFEGNPACQNNVEGNTDHCATHNAEIRKAAKAALKIKVVTPPRKVSKKMAKDLQDYGVLRRAYLKEHEQCEARVAPDCDGHSQEVHHAAKRGSNLLDASTFVAICRPCHTFIETKMSAEERRERGFLITKNEIL